MSKSIELYNEFAPYYREYSNRKTAYLKSLDNIIINFIRSQSTAIDTKTAKMLDIGAGDGIRAINIATKVNISKLILLDDSPEMIKLCKGISEAKPILGDISSEDLPLERSGYQIITCLWNVLGHIENSEKRKIGLKKIYDSLSNDGLLFLDVNNRYNIKNYGVKNVLINFLKDIFNPSVKNGDVDFKIEICKNKIIPAQVHIFNPYEIESLLKKTGLRIIKKYYIDYSTGKITKSFLAGQLFYILKKCS